MFNKELQCTCYATLIVVPFTNSGYTEGFVVTVTLLPDGREGDTSGRCLPSMRCVDL